MSWRPVPSSNEGKGRASMHCILILMPAVAGMFLMLGVFVGRTSTSVAAGPSLSASAGSYAGRLRILQPTTSTPAANNSTMTTDENSATSRPQQGAAGGAASNLITNLDTSGRLPQVLNGTGVPLSAPCNTSLADGEIRLFVGVVSGSRNRERRDAIRQTWASSPALERVIFTVNRPSDTAVLDQLRQEADQFGDLMLVGHIADHITNNSYQTLEVFRSAYAYHKPLTHVMKVDDDIYVHAERLLDWLKEEPRQHMVAAQIFNGFSPVRDPKAKHYTSKEEWGPDQNDLVWAGGAGYIWTFDLAKIAATGGAIRCSPGHFFKWEDITAATWLACFAREKGIRIHWAHDNRFNGQYCNEGDFMSHHQDPAKMRCIFSTGKCCER